MKSKIIVYFFISCTAIINILVFEEIMSYGHGLGDLGEMFVTTILSVLIVILTIVKWKKNSVFYSNEYFFNNMFNSNNNLRNLCCHLLERG